MTSFTKAGLLAIRDGRVLLFRKRTGPRALILPGGKLEPGETPEQALRRELSEEFTAAEVSALRYLGSYEHEAAEGYQRITIELFAGEVRGEPVPAAEIAEIVWFHCGTGDWEDLAPSLREKIFPDLITRGLLQAA